MSNFTKYHLAISKNNYQGLKPLTSIFSIEEKEKNFSYFSFLFRKVGSLWKWDLRPKYLTMHDEIIERLGSQDTRLFIFKKGQQLIGYCLASKSQEDVANQFPNVIEIENFGFFPEYTGKGYGSYFLNDIFGILFEDYDNIYLSTRSTNHKKVVSFYEKNNMELICKETFQDDLIRSSVSFFEVEKTAA